MPTDRPRRRIGEMLETAALAFVAGICSAPAYLELAEDLRWLV